MKLLREFTKSTARQLGLCPVRLNLITGSPRTGTSALYRWLKGNREFAAFYESRILVAAHAFLSSSDRFAKLTEHRPDVLAAARRAVADYYSGQRLLLGRRVLEKEPLEPVAFADGSYRSFLSHVLELYPTSKIVLMSRDPVAVVWSMVQRTWGKSLSVAESRRLSLEEACLITADGMRIVKEMQVHRNIYVCKYDQLVEAPLDESRRVCDFLGVSLKTPFQPQASSQVGFSDFEIAQIKELVGLAPCATTASI